MTARQEVASLLAIGAAFALVVAIVVGLVR